MTPQDIRALRAALNLTQPEFAKRLGLSTRGVQHIEADEGKPEHRKPSGSVLLLLGQLVEGLEKEKKHP